MTALQLSLSDLHRQLQAGETSAKMLLEASLEKIADLDDTYNAIIELNPEARDIAAASDRRLASGGDPGLLEGIPILIKDNIATGDQMQTTAGSLALAGLRCNEDATIVRQLRAAGAVIVGKTNLSEWANFRSTRSTGGWSSRGGQTRNAHNPDLAPGGSSSGSGVAVALGYCPAAIGTETDGSIVSPAALNGIVGFKPSLGWVSRRGIIPITAEQDTAGPITRSVADAAWMMAVLAAPDPQDPITTTQSIPSFQSLDLHAAKLKGARIGIARSYCGYHADLDQVFEDQLERLSKAGAVLIDGVPLPPRTRVREDEVLAMSYEFPHQLKDWLAQFAPKHEMSDINEIRAYNQHHEDQAMPHFGQEIFDRAAGFSALNDPECRSARDRVKQIMGNDGIEKITRDLDLDAFAAPTAAPAWPINWQTGDNPPGSASSPAAIAGAPHITLPMGTCDHRPVGFSLFTRRGQDADLLILAADIERCLV